MREAPKSKKLRIVFALFSCAAIFLFCLSSGLGQRYCALSSCVQARWKEPGLTIGMLKRGLQNEKKNGGAVTDAAIWLELNVPVEGGRILEGTSPRTARLTMLLVYGNASYAYLAAYRSGACPAPGDSAGCALDRMAADQLFGGEDVLGCRLTIDGKTRVVRGIMEGDEGVVITQADEQSDERFGAAALLVTPGIDGEQAAALFFSALGISPDAVIDTPFFAPFVHTLSLLPAWVLCAVVILRMLRRTSALRLTPAIRLCTAAVALFSVALLLWAAQFAFVFPDRLIPTKWSDFSFWSQRAEQLSDTLQHIRTLEPLLCDLQHESAARGCALTAAGACAFFIVALRTSRIRSIGSYFLCAFGSLAVTYLSVLALNSLNMAAAPSRTLWLIFPLVLAVQSVTDYIRPPSGLTPARTTGNSA